MRKHLSIYLTLSIIVMILSAGCGGGGGGGSSTSGGTTIPIEPPPGGGTNPPPPNQPPSITSISPASSPTTPINLRTSEQLRLVVSAADPDKDPLQYTWTCDRGTVLGTSQEATYTAPGSPCTATVNVTVSDGKNTPVSAKVYIAVAGSTDPLPQNQPPIVSLSVNPSTIQAGGTATFTASASDPDGDPLVYTWIVNAGSIQTQNQESMVWLAPDTGGTYSVTVSVSDGKAEAVLASASVVVQAKPGTNPDPGETFTNGLTARYYKNNGVLAHPVFRESDFRFERIDANINFDWGKSSPHPDLIDPSDGKPRDFNIRWTGHIRCENPGVYTFQIKYDDGVRLIIGNDKNEEILLIDAWSGGPGVKTASITLEGGKWYPIQLDYFEDESDAYVLFYWTPPGATDFEIVPTTMLRSD